MVHRIDYVITMTIAGQKCRRKRISGTRCINNVFQWNRRAIASLTSSERTAAVRAQCDDKKLIVLCGKFADALDGVRVIDGQPKKPNVDPVQMPLQQIEIRVLEKIGKIDNRQSRGLDTH